MTEYCSEIAIPNKTGPNILTNQVFLRKKSCSVVPRSECAKECCVLSLLRYMCGWEDYISHNLRNLYLQGGITERSFVIFRLLLSPNHAKRFSLSCNGYNVQLKLVLLTLMIIPHFKE